MLGSTYLMFHNCIVIGAAAVNTVHTKDIQYCSVFDGDITILVIQKLPRVLIIYICVLAEF